MSGAGLTGAAVASLLASPGASPVENAFPLRCTAGRSERPAVRHIRDHARYLANGSLIDTIRLPAIVLRGIIDNLALLLPLLIVAAQLTELLFVIVYRVGFDRVRLIPILMVLLFALIGLAQPPPLYRVFARWFDWTRRNCCDDVIAGALLALIVTLVLMPTFVITQQAMDVRWNDVVGVGPVSVPRASPPAEIIARPSDRGRSV